MVNTLKFSQFTLATKDNSTNYVVGLSSLTGGTNIYSPFTVSWTTAGRPTSPYPGLLGYNTNFSQYEYWNGLIWVQLAAGSTGTVFSVSTGTGLTGGPITTSGTISFATIAANSLWANTTGGSAVPTVTPLSTFLLSANNLSDLTNAATARTNIGLAIGVNVQAWSGILDSIVSGTLPTSVQVGVNSLAGGVGATAGTFWRGDGTWAAPAGSGTVNAGLGNQLAYYMTNGTAVSGLATANNGVLITNGTGIPSINTTLPTTVQGNITSLGTITSGVWNGTVIDLTHGGTNANLTASNGGIVYSGASSLAILAGTATARQMLQSGASGAPAWSTATWPGTTTINQLLYSSTANSVGGLATANSSVLVTDSGGIPSLSTTLPASLVIPSPQITTGLFDVNNKEMIAFSTPGGTIVNWLQVSNAITTGAVGLSVAGSDTNILLSISGKGNAGVQMQGYSNATNKSAGYVGEEISSTIAFASAVSLTSNTPANVTSISLTAGDWDVYGNVFFAPSVGFSAITCWASLTSVTSPDQSLRNQISYSTAIILTSGINIPYLRVNVSSTTTVYLSANAIFASGTGTACGGIYARRR